MIKVGLALPVVALFITLLFASDAKSISQPTNVELEIPQTKLIVSGIAPPGSLLIVYKGGAPVASSTTNSNGDYAVQLSSISPGVHTIGVSYEIAGRTSTIVEKNVSINPQQTNNLEVLTTPLLYKSGPQFVIKPQNVILNGFAPPQATITLFSTTGGNFVTTSNTSGRFTFSLDSSQFAINQETFRVSYSKDSKTSLLSSPLLIEIQPADSNQPSNLEPDITVNPEQPTTPIVTVPRVFQIESDTVTFQGIAQPGNQIIIYVNGKVVGSVLVDGNGRWEFPYVSSDVVATFQFASCLNGSCSLPSDAIELRFGIIAGTCELGIELYKHRFWDIKTDGNVVLRSDPLTYDATILIDWGDSLHSTYRYTKDSDFLFEHNYLMGGSYSGKITIYVDESCQEEIYFTADIDAQDEKSNYLLLVFIVATIIFSWERFINHQYKRQYVKTS